MLILDKQKAVERIVALSSGVAVPPEPGGATPRKRARTYHRLAAYDPLAPVEAQRERDRRKARTVIATPAAT